MPSFPDPAAQAVYDYAKALHETHNVSQELHDATVAAVRERGVVELVGLLGHYTLVAMTLNAFDFPLRDGETPDLQL